ncbi:MAG TPA: protein kinase [Bacteroidota bacterium]|nr:protein kinase [Bacteroidota bacterium]
MLGQKISQYKVLEKLGEGGMGVVYKAEDTKLDRIVALKFLPSHLNATDQDKARFTQEAKAAAALNHPNVCSIIDIQDHDGQMFIVMEFIDGQTLRAKLGTLSLKQSIDIGIQIADGLAAAHEKGIVHRDIKPENVMVRKDGICQIMDFGLAKLRNASSQVNRLTKEGSTVGTAGYMSPEQVLGQDADHRSDIFSMGVMLYEMFTGQLPFRGVHETALAYEIVNVDAAPMSTLKPELDPGLDAIVLDCLEKDPKERCQSIAEVGRDLRRIKRESTRQRHSRITAARPALRQSQIRSSSSVGPSEPDSRVAEPAAKKSMSGWIVTVAVAVVMLALGYGIALLKRAPAIELPVIRATVDMPRNVKYYNVIGGNSELSPDGSMIAFVGVDSLSHNDLWIHVLRTGEAKRLAGAENATYPAWSPDSRTVAFFADGKLKTIDAAGGPVLTLADAPYGRGISWTGKGQILFLPNLSDPIVCGVPASGGTVEKAIVIDSALHASPRYPQILPDENHVLVSLLNVTTNGSDLYIAALDGTAPRKLSADCSYGRFAGGHLFFLRQGILMAQQFDATSLVLTGAPVSIQDHVNSWAARAKADFSVSGGGLLLYSSGGAANSGQLLWAHGNGSEEVIGTFNRYLTFELSPDETHILYDAYDPVKANGQIWTYDLISKVQSQVTGGINMGDQPKWSADGKTFYYNQEIGNSKAYIFAKRTDGTGNEELIARGEEGTKVGYYPLDVSPDGRYLLLSMLNESGGELGCVDLSVTTRPIPVEKLGTKGRFGRFSPDSKWIVYSSDEAVTSKISVTSFKGHTGMWQIALDSQSPRWDNNKIMYFSRANDREEVIDVSLSSGTPVFGPPQPLLLGGKQFANFLYGTSRDGKRYLVYRPENSEGSNELSLVVNWKQLLDSKAH